jgi:adenylate cyclase
VVSSGWQEREPVGVQRLWDEIRRRNLDRVTAAYAVVAWVLVQAGGIVFPAFALPEWTLRLLILLLVVGLPAVWIVLWHAFPEMAEQPAAQRPRRYTEWVLIGLLALVLVATLGEFAWSRWRPPVAAGGTPPSQQNASIAVLAFTNMSGDPDNEYFSEGISEELLNDLAQVPRLRVAGRTSSFAFRNRSATIEDIGRALNVRAVLEGSVRRQQNRVRITAQLIDATNDYHIWSHTYDRDIVDIFAVQDEISRIITRELTGRLLGGNGAGGERVAPAHRRPSPDAYTAYLKGRFFVNRRNTADMLRAENYFRRALELAPDYADAHASLGMAYELLYLNGQQRDTLGSARNEIAAALRLDPANLTARLTDANIAGDSWNWVKASSSMRRLAEQFPNNAEIHHFYADLFIPLGMPERALAEQQKSTALDPLAPINYDNTGDVLHYLGRDREALAAFQQALTLDPTFVFSLKSLCVIYADSGKIEEAKQILHDRLVPLDGEDGSYSNWCKTSIALREHDRTGLKRLARSMEQAYAGGTSSASQVGYTYAAAGDFDSAMRWMERSCDEHDINFFYMILDPDFPAALKSDQRWRMLLQRPTFNNLARVRAEVLARGAGD